MSVPRAVLGGGYRLKCNEAFFDIIDSEEKAYFLGLLMADGCNTNRGFTIALVEEDKDILEKFIFCIKYEGRLHYSRPVKDSPRQRCRLTITSKKLSESLKKHGVVPRKTHIADFPSTVPKFLYRHFIRGVFDGDGHILMTNNNKDMLFGITGNVLLIKRIKDILSEECMLNKSIKLHRASLNKENIVRMNYGGNLQCERIREFLYKDCTIFLNRKYKTFHLKK